MRLNRRRLFDVVQKIFRAKSVKSFNRRKKMFQNLKNKIITETGQDPVTIPFKAANNRSRQSISSHNSLSIDELSRIEEVIFEDIKSLLAAITQSGKFITERSGNKCTKA